MLIDLTQEFVNNMMVYPGDDIPLLTQVRNFSEHHFNSFRIEAGLHAGTHIDGPMHMTDSNTFISEIDINKFFGKGCIIDISDISLLCWDEKYKEILIKKEIVLFYTGHSKYFGTPQYLNNYPVIDSSFAEKLVEFGIKMIGVDSLSPDYEPFPVHTILLGNNILIAENLTNLDKLLNVSSFDVIAFPLKMRSDGAMARIAARILG